MTGAMLHDAADTIEAYQRGEQQRALLRGLPLPRDIEERLIVLNDAWGRYVRRDLSLEELEGAVAELVEASANPASKKRRTPGSGLQRGSKTD